jgi:hypothetical protein
MQFRFLILFLTIVCGLSTSLRGLQRVDDDLDDLDAENEEFTVKEIQAYRDNVVEESEAYRAVVQESEADKIDRQDDIEVEYELLRDLLREIIRRERLNGSV